MKATVEYYNGGMSAIKTHEAGRIDLDYEGRCVVVKLFGKSGELTGWAVYPEIFSLVLDRTA